MHWGEEFVSGRDARGQVLRGVNALAQPGFCPDSKQPELKFAAVSVKKLDLPWRLSAAAWSAADGGASLRAQLRALMPEFDYAHCVPVAGPQGREGWSFEAACAVAPAAALVARVAQALDLHGVGLLRYADARRGCSRLLRLAGEGGAATLQSLLLVGEAGVAAWLLPLWREARPVAPFGRQLLAPEAMNLGVAAARRSPQVCNCFDVSEARIRDQLGRCSGSEAERLQACKARCAAAPQCGSCLPALRRLVTQVQAEELTS